MAKDMRVKDLKDILNDLPDDLPVIIPVISEDDANKIYGFRKVRTVGLLECKGEEDQEALCLNTAAKGYDIADQIYFSGKSRIFSLPSSITSDISVNKILFGNRDESYTK